MLRFGAGDNAVVPGVVELQMVYLLTAMCALTPEQWRGGGHDLTVLDRVPGWIFLKHGKTPKKC